MWQAPGRDVPDCCVFWFLCHVSRSNSQVRTDWPVARRLPTSFLISSFAQPHAGARVGRRPISLSSAVHYYSLQR